MMVSKKAEQTEEGDRLLESYLPMVDFYAETLGRNCEVILHDLRRLESSIVAIRNNHISGRQVGGCITGFALELIEKRVYEQKSYVANYIGKTDDGRKTVRASTFFIRDSRKKVVGMLCVNVDITAMLAAKKVISDFIAVDDEVYEEEVKPAENYDLDPGSLISSRVLHVLSRYEVEPGRMSADEKKAVVLDLAELGVFRIKGAVAEVSKMLQVSEPTIYRYLKNSPSPR